SRRRHTRFSRDWSSDVCSSDLIAFGAEVITLTVLGYLGARSRDLFIGEGMLFIGAYLFVGKWLHDVIYFTIAGAAVRGHTVTRQIGRASCRERGDVTWMAVRVH